MISMMYRLILVLAGTTTWAGCQLLTYTNFIRQIQLPSGVQWDMTVAETNPDGGSLSPLAIDPGGAQFQLWTVNSSPLTSSLLDSKYVSTYIPMVSVVIRTEDPYTIIPRTRADRPYDVDITITGLLIGATDPVASKSVKLLRHVQSYGVGGTGADINRSQAILLSQASIAANGTQTLTYSLNSVPGGDRTKVRGEERFSIFSLEDYQAPESQLASQFVQIWPVADGSITGVTDNQFIRYALPQLTLTLNDLYPSSTTYAQVYKGNAQLGAAGTIVPGSVLVISDSVPQNRVLIVNKYDSVFDADGLWTMELLTVTPFGIDRLAHVSFDLDRTLKIYNTGINTIE